MLLAHVKSHELQSFPRTYALVCEACHVTRDLLWPVDQKVHADMAQMGCGSRIILALTLTLASAFISELLSAP